MTYALDLHDIQGNIVKGYGRMGYPKARYVFFTFDQDGHPGSGQGETARQFIADLVPLVTTSAPWNPQTQPPATTNIAFTYAGLRTLGLPDASMRRFPADFRMGMKARRAILGDNGPSAPKHWDSIWQDSYAIHMWLSINGIDEGAVETRYQQIVALVDRYRDGVAIACGHRGDSGQDDLPYQSASAIYINGRPSSKEHFGYTDGVSDPYFEGQSRNPQQDAIGAGKVTRDAPDRAAGWQPLRTGEFLLGHRDEADEYPEAPIPRPLSFNGTFMVYRKLHENVGKFEAYIDQVAGYFRGGKDEAAAKFVGRWPNGAPLAIYPTKAEADAFGEQWDAAIHTLFVDKQASDVEKAKAREVYDRLKHTLVAFSFDDDLAGGKCPVGAHSRRMNPRGALEFGTDGAFNTPGALTNRRRILRRGLPYGDSSDRHSNDGNHGIIFMAINASLERQFEFAQQQWANYGNDFKLSNQQDPIIGNHDQGQMTVEGDAASGRAPVFCSNIPRFVETRGGEYFFIPSLTALRMIAAGIVDPT